VSYRYFCFAERILQIFRFEFDDFLIIFKRSLFGKALKNIYLVIPDKNSRVCLTGIFESVIIEITVDGIKKTE
jgi:hypothetical protein